MKASKFTPLQLQQWVVWISCALFLLKIAAYFLTHSVAILTDALESTVNVVTGFTGLYGLRLAAKPRDDNHPYGHGKIELISASFEGILVLTAGMIIVYEALVHLVHPAGVARLDLGILMVVLTALINYILGRWCIRVGRRHHSVALEASGKHLQSDTWTTVGIVIGLILLRVTGIGWIDSVVALVFALIIMVEGGRIIRKTIAGLTDEADSALLTQLITVLNARKREAWIDLHNLRVIKYGAVLHVDCHITVPWYYHVNQANAEVRALENLISEAFQQSLEMFVHTDGCVPPGSCRVCPLSVCPERKQAFEKRLEWNLQNVTLDARHDLAD